MDEREALIKLKVTPNARRNEVLGWRGDELAVKLTAPPVEGKANRALVRFLAQALEVRAVDVSLVRGEGARRKLVRIAGLDAGEVRQRLGAYG